jgi:DNA-binding MarR family transcriptional regulator
MHPLDPEKSGNESEFARAGNRRGRDRASRHLGTIRGGTSGSWATQADDTACWLELYPRLAGIALEVQRRTSLSSTEVAVLFTLYPVHETAVRTLRRGLRVDAGHLSRILAAFEREGLVITATPADDRRQRQVSLTAAGRERCSSLAVTVTQVSRDLLAPRAVRELASTLLQ